MKLRDLLKENTLGELPSSKLFKINKETGKFESPNQRKSTVIKEEKLTTNIIDEIDFSPLEKEIKKVLGFPVILDKKIISNNRLRLSSSKNYIKQTGLFKNILSEIYVTTFNSWFEKNKISFSLDVSYSQKQGGSNGMTFLNALYDISKKQWKFRGV